MKAVPDYFSLREYMPNLLTIVLLEFVGRQMAGTGHLPRWIARGFAAVGIFGYAVVGIATWKPATPWEFVEVMLRSMLAMWTVHGLIVVLLPTTYWLYQHL